MRNPAAGHPRIAVIGAGFSGIAVAHALKRAGLQSFEVFESSAGLGGTWFDNRYPSATVDTPSHLYCFSFNTHDWSCTHPGHAEIRAYLEKTVDECALRPHFRFEATVRSAIWSDREARYEVPFADGSSRPFEAVIACVGFLNVPFVPAWAETDAFSGAVFHTARWPHDVDLAGKRVGIVGTGSSAVQVIVEAAKTAASVTVFQREPNWVLPKGNRDFTPAERRRLRRGLPYRLRRLKLYCQHERFRVFGKAEQPGSKTNAMFQRIAEDHLQRALGGRPDLMARLTPTFAFFGKRPIINDDFYPALTKPNVVLAAGAAALGADGVTDLDGRMHALDVVVLATGFQAARYLSRLEVKGAEGIDLKDAWAGEPSAYLGCCMPGFPNFFMLYGPNSSGCPAVSMLECQAGFAAQSLADMARRGATRVEVARSAYERYNRWLQARLSTSVFRSTTSYFTSPSGRVVTQWPFSTTRFRWIATMGRRRAMKFRR